MRYVFLLVLCLLGSLSGVAQKKPAAPMLHVLYVMEQEDPQYGLLNLRNEEAMSQIVSTVKWGLDYGMTTTYLTKKDFTSSALKKAIAALKTSPRDIIMLYYSGFGLTPPNPKATFANWKLRDVAEMGLSVDVVETWLMAKQIHLSLIIADCSAQQMINPIVAASIGPGPDLRKRVIKRLFVDNCGIVKMGSSLPSALSWANERSTFSIFTGGFSEAFGSLLLTSDPAKLPQITFAYLGQQTKGAMASSLYGLPYKQVPVVEIKSCRRAVRSLIASPVPGTSTDETLNGLLNAIAMNRDSLQRAALVRQLSDYVTDDATVDVERLLEINWQKVPLDPQKELTNYTLQTYLSQLSMPLKTDPQPVWLHSIEIMSKELGSDQTKRINHLRLRETWQKID
ncbi:MAG: hypothetical protein EOO39_04240 [Cytophagaceae bacterium]|nr:MAG: hypothetical protein EOO39_04240 [Cytophagaceae bacterium]